MARNRKPEKRYNIQVELNERAHKFLKMLAKEERRTMRQQGGVVIDNTLSNANTRFVGVIPDDVVKIAEEISRILNNDGGLDTKAYSIVMNEVRDRFTAFLDEVRTGEFAKNISDDIRDGGITLGNSENDDKVCDKLDRYAESVATIYFKRAGK